MADELALFTADLKTYLKETGTLYFSANELTLAIAKALIIYSKSSPYIVKDTTNVTTTADSYDLDISAITGLIDHARSIQEPIEYEAGQDPPEYRGREIIDDTTIRMKIASAPSADGEAVYVKCEKVHELDSDSTTLSAEGRSICLDIAAAEAILQWCQNCMVYLAAGENYINTLNVGASPEGYYRQYTAETLQLMQALGAQKVVLYRDRLKALEEKQERPQSQLWPTT